ncbi:terminase small subunit [Aneurinibacillus aneurinilyticus]|uniref:terminase small subunit n=1 Tax=Aneurinibacillus aneurinilyticus TaxID=1391 RepID=UPI00366ADD80
MARATNPNRIKAQKIFLEHQGEITNRKIAEILNEKEKTISAWKSRDKWNAALQNDDCSTTKEKRSTTKKDEPLKTQTPPKKLDDDESYELTPKQHIFVQEYLIDLNATQAAIRAGYSPDTAHVQGPRLLGNVRVQQAIESAMQAREKRTGITADKVLEQIAKIAFVDLRDIVTWDEGKIVIRPSEEIDGTVLAEISETVSESGTVRKRVKVNDRMRALDMLAKHTGLLDEHRRKLDEARNKRAAEKHALDMAKANVDQDTGDVEIVVSIEDDDNEG